MQSIRETGFILDSCKSLILAATLNSESIDQGDRFHFGFMQIFNLGCNLELRMPKLHFHSYHWVPAAGSILPST